MNTYVLPWVHFVLLILMSLAGGFSMVHIVLAGMAITSSKSGKKEEAIGRVKWILFGTIVALSAYFLARFVGYEASLVAPSTGSGSAPTLSFTPSPVTTLPGSPSGNGVAGWIETAVFASLSDLLTMFALVFWALTGFTGPSAMVKENIQTSQNGDVMGIFSPHTWSAMMYVQHSLYFIVGVAALISFVLQGIQIQNAPSSGVAKERAVSLAKSVVLTGLLLGASPYLLGLLNAGVSDFTQYITHLISLHTEQLVQSQSTVLSLVFGQTPLAAKSFEGLKLFGGASVANAMFNLVFSIVNLCTWLVFQWRRIVLGMLITLMPLFYVGLVTGKKADIAIHWWKEVAAYLLIPFIASIFLLMAQVFIGI